MTLFRSTRPPRPLALLLALATLAVSPASGQAPATVETFRDELRVREVSVLVPLSRRLSLARPENIRASSFVSTVDGLPCPVLRVEKMPASEWHVAIYIDPAFGSPEAQVASLLALARRAKKLTELGDVEVLLADPRPTPLGPPTRDPEVVLTHLAQVAQAAQRRGESNQIARPATPVETPSRLHRQADRLARFAAERRPTGAGLLFLVGDGSADSYTTTEAAFEGASNVLSAYGWLAVPVAIADLEEEATGVGISEVESYRSQGPQIKGIDLLALIRWVRTRRLPRKPIPPSIETQLAAELAPMRRLARATGGMTLGTEPQLAPALAAIADRWRLWLAVPVRDDGQLAPLEILDADDGERLTSRRVVRGGAPEALSAARARGLFEERDLKGPLALSATLAGGSAGSASKLTLRLGEAKKTGSVRITLAFAQEGKTTLVRHLVQPSAQEFTIEAPEAAAAELIAVIVQPLTSEDEAVWGGAVIVR